MSQEFSDFSNTSNLSNLPIQKALEKSPFMKNYGITLIRGKLRDFGSTNIYEKRYKYLFYFCRTSETEQPFIKLEEHECVEFSDQVRNALLLFENKTQWGSEYT